MTLAQDRPSTRRARRVIVVGAGVVGLSCAVRLLEASMVAGMLDIFPDASTTGLVEARIGRSWAK